MFQEHRPVRLSARTRALAQWAKNGEFGKEMESRYCAVLDDPDFLQKDVYERFVAALEAVVEQDPIRLTDGEWLAGSAAFNKARQSRFPIALAGRDPQEVFFWGADHLTPGFEKVLKEGLDSVEEEIRASLANHAPEPDKCHYLIQTQRCLALLRRWHRRYLEALDGKIAGTGGEIQARYRAVRRNLIRVPFAPAEDFREAVQSLWFMFSILRSLGNWAAVGRVDYLLGPYLERDLAAGTITLDEAREYIAHFWIKGCDWVDLQTNPFSRPGSGDGQNYQNVVLSGLDDQGNDITNPVTYLVLDVVEELGISDFPIAVRLSTRSPETLVRRVAQVAKLGGGILAMYNDDVVIPSLVKFGYPVEEANVYANDGCWEVQVPGRTDFNYWAWDVLAIFQREVLRLTEEGPSRLPYRSIPEILEAFLNAVDRQYQKDLARDHRSLFIVANPVMSMLVDGCIRDGVDFASGGAHYRVRGVHAGGLPDVANALCAIDHVVFQKKMMDLDRFIDIVKADFEGHEALAACLRTEIRYYGNGGGEGDEMMKTLFRAYTELIGRTKIKDGWRFPAGISTFGRQITAEFLDNRVANPTGHRKGAFLSNNITPTPGTDTAGATALLRSYGMLNLVDLPGGTALEIRLSPATVRGEEGTESLMDFLYAFCELGGYFIQPDIVDAALLRAAQKDPEAYSNLSVRVTGWSARFRTLSENWQKMIIDRTEAGY